MATDTPAPLPHIVVLGAGFGGLTFCQKFPADIARITVIDRQNHHLFQPLLYQVASAGLSAIDIAQPIRAILAEKPNLEVLMAEVTGVDFASRRVMHEFGELAYDYLVLALGGVTSYFGHPEWEPHAPGLKSLADALHIRRKILHAFERAEAEPDPVKQQELMNIVVVGGGPTGVELAGAFAELARTVLRRDFKHIDPARAHILLIEGGPRVLAAFPPDLSASAQRQLEHLGVEVRTGLKVEEIRDGEIIAGGKSIRAANIIWGAGVGGNPLAKKLGIELDRAGRIKVQPDLSLPGHPEVFAVGDMVVLVDKNGLTVPGVSPAAMQMGAHVAKIILAEQRQGRVEVAQRPAFAYWDKGTMATIGRSAAVAHIGRLKFSGWPAWAAWLFVHLIFLVSFRSKLSVLMSWTYSYFTYKRGARVITGTGGSPPAASA
ncbi:MAG TPA: NAD(P)/FAD-dependent oxidoreductase [Opitutaceae bacterium]|jgi:NADH dehydrogenase|nr:NAD(P)/FAD-dependent oxidoreductase [Opitutaceae bacterium]